MVVPRVLFSSTFKTVAILNLKSLQTRRSGKVTFKIIHVILHRRNGNEIMAGQREIILLILIGSYSNWIFHTVLVDPSWFYHFRVVGQAISSLLSGSLSLHMRVPAGNEFAGLTPST